MWLSVSLVINLLGASGSRAQMVVPHGTVYHGSSYPTDHSLFLVVALLGFALLLWSLLPQACSDLGCWLRPVSVNFPDLFVLGIGPAKVSSSEPLEIPDSGALGPAEVLARA